MISGHGDAILIRCLIFTVKKLLKINNFAQNIIVVLYYNYKWSSLPKKRS